MKIIVGSKNQVKIDAVKEVVFDYPLFAGCEVVGEDPNVPVYGQPKTLQETIEGARDRSRAVFGDCKYSFGIESGLMAVPHTKTGVMDITACAIYDGKGFYLGLSSAFEYPVKVTELVLHSGLDVSQAYKALGLTANEKIGVAEGVIAHLTKGRLNRKNYTKQAIMMALTQLENPELY